MNREFILEIPQPPNPLILLPLILPRDPRSNPLPLLTPRNLPSLIPIPILKSTFSILRTSMDGRTSSSGHRKDDRISSSFERRLFGSSMLFGGRMGLLDFSGGGADP